MTSIYSTIVEIFKVLLLLFQPRLSKYYQILDLHENFLDLSFEVELSTNDLQDIFCYFKTYLYRKALSKNHRALLSYLSLKILAVSV